MFERRDTPFLHWVDDEFLTDAETQACVDEFPYPDDQRWHTFHAAHENNKSQHPAPTGPATAAVLERLTGGIFTGELERLTGTTPLRSDLTGGGLHQTTPGGYLDVHVDFNQLDGWRRALNLLVYLNADWSEGDGGELELWDGQECRQFLAPVAGRAVLFPTNDTSWHGHPNPTRIMRRSIAVYYFTPGQVGRVHSTEWLTGGR